MGKVDSNINSPFLLVALEILSLLICFILFMLYYQFYHFDKKGCFSSCLQVPGDKPGPGKWEKHHIMV
jgi:hypothetical protein